MSASEAKRRRSQSGRRDANDKVERALQQYVYGAVSFSVVETEKVDGKLMREVEEVQHEVHEQCDFEVYGSHRPN